jgi:hypothetical protein
MDDHIRALRMWNYVHLEVGLTSDEVTHMNGCPECASLYNACLSAQSPNDIDLDSSKTGRRSS